MKISSIAFGFGLAAFVTIFAILPADGANPKDNPHEAIARRNIFRLISTPLSPARTQKVVPSVSISLAGMTTVLGFPEVLFKVSNPAETGKLEKTYALGVGQTQDDIKVVSIDMKNLIVKFSNHGVIQTVSFGM